MSDDPTDSVKFDPRLILSVDPSKFDSSPIIFESVMDRILNDAGTSPSRARHYILNDGSVTAPDISGSLQIVDDGDIIFEIFAKPEAQVGEVDLGECAYYRGVGICGFGCVDEPRCQTEEPENGWPSVVRDLLFGTQTELELDYPKRTRTINELAIHEARADSTSVKRNRPPRAQS